LIQQRQEGRPDQRPTLELGERGIPGLHRLHRMRVLRDGTGVGTAWCGPEAAQGPARTAP